MSNKFGFSKLLKLKKSDELYKIFSNISWLFLDRILRMGMGLFVGIWVARYLGVKQFGLLSYATAFVGLFSTFSDLGLSSLAIRAIANKPEQKDLILGTIFWLKLFGGIVTLLLTVGSIFAFRQDDSLTIGIVAILASVSIFQAFDTIDLWFQSQVNSKYIVIVKNIAFIVVVISRIILIYLHAPLLAFAGATLTEAVLGALGMIFIYRIKKYSIYLWRWNLTLAKALLRESWPLILSSFTIMIYMKIDQIMLGKMLNIQAVGLYSSATRVSEIWYFIPTAIASSMAPSIYATKKDKNEFLYYQKIEQLLRILSFTAILIALPMLFLSGTIMTGLFGGEYAASETILAVHIWAALFSVIVCTGKLNDRRSPSYGKDLLKLIDQFNLHQQFIVLGLISRFDQIQLMRRSLAVIQPSLFEGGSTVVEDARTLNKTILLSDILVHREQNPPCTTYFSPHSSEDLAQKIATLLPTLSPGPDLLAEVQTFKQNQKFSQTYAQSFVGLAYKALNKSTTESKYK
jgi:polysaccharide transporter, PST family